MKRTVAVRASSSNSEVSAQTRARTGGLSQKKWFTLLGPQKGKLKIHVVCTVATGNPEHQDAAASWAQALLVAHDDWVVQRVTDGHIAVICHCGQDAAFSSPKEEEEIHLSGTAKEGDGCVLDDQGPQHLGHNDQVETYLKKDKFLRKKYMGLCSAESAVVTRMIRMLPIRVTM